MLNLALDAIQRSFLRLNYVWHPFLNLVGVRSTQDLSNRFNDHFLLWWLQPQLALNGLSVAQQQALLNTYLYVGANGKALAVDGQPGANTDFAKAAYQKTVNTWRLAHWTITTDPGADYLLNPMNADGCAVLVPGQYKNMWCLGFHQKNPAHPALVQQGAQVTVYLDNNRNLLAEEGRTTKTGWFGINGHHASAIIVSQLIGKWSAGCQVFPDSTEHAQMLGVCGTFKAQLKNLFTYTLLRERELA